MSDDLNHDPQEDSPEFRRLLDATMERARREITGGDGPLPFGGCHQLWARVKKILWKEHRIRWRSPNDMNPDVIFD
jgi:hypothetical protein